MSNQTELLPIEKAIILFVQASNAQNTAEQIKEYQENIKELLSLEEDKIKYTQIWTMYALAYGVYMDKAMRSKAKELADTIILDGTNLYKVLSTKRKEIEAYDGIDPNKIDTPTWNSTFPRTYEWTLDSCLKSLNHMIQTKQFNSPL